MKFVKFTYIDHITKIPVSESPASNGPELPQELCPTFDIESARATGVPQVYGFTEESTITPDWVRVISEQEFFEAFKAELKQRIGKRRKQAEVQGVIVGDNFFPSDKDSQSRIFQLVNSFQADKQMKFVDFEVHQGVWVSIDRKQAASLGIELARHIQKGFSWSKELQEKVDALVLTIDTLDQVNSIYTEISNFGVVRNEVSDEGTD